MIGPIGSHSLIGIPSPSTEALRAAKTNAPEGLSKATGMEGRSSVSGPSFAKTLERAVSSVDEKIKTAESEQGKLLTGETGNLHQAMIAVQESGVAFGLMVEVRNKLMESYQELMRMQV
jgi:flagellar hook-basal body complex protein FliE